MLILTRRRNEAVRIGDIRILVTRIGNGSVRLAFDTPAGMKVYREEIYHAIERENQAAQIPSRAELERLGANGD